MKGCAFFLACFLLVCFEGWFGSEDGRGGVCWWWADVKKLGSGLKLVGAEGCWYFGCRLWAEKEGKRWGGAKPLSEMGVLGSQDCVLDHSPSVRNKSPPL